MLKYFISVGKSRFDKNFKQHISLEDLISIIITDIKSSTVNQDHSARFKTKIQSERNSLIGYAINSEKDSKKCLLQNKIIKTFILCQKNCNANVQIIQEFRTFDPSQLPCEGFINLELGITRKQRRLKTQHPKCPITI